MEATEFDALMVDGYCNNYWADQEVRRKALFAATGNAEAEYRIEQTDRAREWEVIKTIRKADELGLGWTGSAVDAMHLARSLRRHGVPA